MNQRANPDEETTDWRAVCGERLHGCVSSEGWRVQQEKVLPGRSRKPRSLDSRVAGNQDSEAYRQGHQQDGCESAGVTQVNAQVAPKVRSPEAESAP